MSRSRPNPFQWLAYCAGRRLPDSMQNWVRHDLVGPWAVPRHLIRSMIPFTPIFVAFLVLFPGELWLRGAMILLSVLLALFYSVAYMEPNRARRLQQHGLDPTLTSTKRRTRRDAERARYAQLHGPISRP